MTDSFIDAATSPDSWKRMSVALRRSAEVIWARLRQTEDSRAATVHHSGSVISFHGPTAFLGIGYGFTAKLLYGLAVESAFKARLIETQPEKVKIDAELNGSGEIISAKLSAFGEKKIGHNLVELATIIGVWDMHRDLGDNDCHAYRAGLEQALKDLETSILWRSKYPVPLNSKHLQEQPPATDVRKWVDPLLDKFIGKLEDQPESEFDLPPFSE